MNIGLLGCGWVGTHCAPALLAEGFHVFGSTTRSEHVASLENIGVKPCRLTISQNGLQGDDYAALLSSDVLIVTIPFKRSLTNPFMYKDILQTVLEAYDTHGPEQKHIIFTSSTSVYPLVNHEVNECFPIEPETDRQAALLATESLVLNAPNMNATVLRLAGLYGYSRKIGAFLAGKTELPNPQGVVNLVHVDDVVGVILAVIKQKLWGELINVVAPHHPTREQLYTYAAHQMGLTAPTFSTQLAPEFKLVSAAKLTQGLNYVFKHPTLKVPHA